MSIFKFKRVLNRVWISVLGVKMVFVMPAKEKNFYISLGYNCFSRWVLTKFGLKPRKKQGELSFPFDLVTTPINSLVQILENDFEDFCDDLYLEDTAESGKMWKNRKYNICFPHDGGLSREELIQRYFARIDNFHKIVLNSENLCFVMTVFDRNYTNSALNSIYNSLQKLRQGREFDFCVVCLADKEAPPSKNSDSSLFGAIRYQEFTVDNIREFSKKWTQMDYINSELIEEIGEFLLNLSIR